MQIVMLGHSNAGKTTYMALMYELMHEGYQGFQIRATTPADHAQLLGDARAIRQGDYPPPTSRRQKHNFSLNFQGRPVSDFTWSDYRGGAITERSTNEDKAALLADLRRSDAIVIFADAHELATDPPSHRGSVT
jgi:hypothetical protein